MALTIRETQKRNFIGIQILVGPEGVSELDMTIGPGSGTIEWKISTDATGVAPANPLSGSGVTQVVTNDDTSQMTLELAFAQPLPAGWQTVAYLETDRVPGDAAFESPKVLTKAEDAAGADILASALDLSAVTPAFEHVPPTAAQLAEAPLLDSMLPPLGLSESDSLAKKEFGDNPSSPQGPFGLADAPVVNANLNWEEMNRLLTVGFLTRMNGANADKHQLTEAGKRSAGFAL